MGESLSIEFSSDGFSRTASRWEQCPWYSKGIRTRTMLFAAKVQIGRISTGKGLSDELLDLDNSMVLFLAFCSAASVFVM